MFWIKIQWFFWQAKAWSTSSYIFFGIFVFIKCFFSNSFERSNLFHSTPNNLSKSPDVYNSIENFHYIISHLQLLNLSFKVYGKRGFFQNLVFRKKTLSKMQVEWSETKKPSFWTFQVLECSKLSNIEKSLHWILKLLTKNLGKLT